MNINIDTITLEMFIAIADTKSFSMASDIVGRTQPALSLQMKKLEEQFGRKFFERSGNKVQLTYDGEVFLSYAKNIVNTKSELYYRFKKQTPAVLLKVGMPEDIATNYLSDILKSFHSLHPDIELEINCDLTLNILANFNKDQYDIAIIKKSNNDYEKNENEFGIWMEPLLWVANENYHAKDILSLITSPEPCVYRSKSIETLNKHNIKWKIQYTTHSLAGKIAALNAGFGVAVLPAKILKKYSYLHDVAKKFNLPPLDNLKISILKNKKSNSEIMDIFCKHIINGI